LRSVGNPQVTVEAAAPIEIRGLEQPLDIDQSVSRMQESPDTDRLNIAV